MRTLIDRLCAVLVATAFLLWPQIVRAQWSDLGLSGREVTQLRSSHGFLYACTSDGLYRKTSDTADSSWVMLGFGAQRVYDVLAMSPETLLVARQITSTGADTVGLWRTTDGGATWNAFQNGLGAGGTADRMVRALLEPPAAAGAVLAATEGGIARSADGGSTWTEVYPSGRYFFLAAGISTLWAGGEGAAFGPIIRRSKDGGQTWLGSFLGGNINRAGSMAFDPSNADVAYLGLTYDLRRTVEDGVSFTSIPLPAGVACTALGNRGFAPLRLYASGDAAPGGATVFKSDDGAASWTSISFPAASSTLEHNFLVRSGSAADTIFLGMGSGVLRCVEPFPTVRVDPPVQESQLELHVSPNPAPGATVVTFSLPNAMRVSLRALDSGGREVATLLSGQYDPGPHRFVWKHRRLPSGVYFLQLRADGQVAIRRVAALR